MKIEFEKKKKSNTQPVRKHSTHDLNGLLIQTIFAFIQIENSFADFIVRSLFESVCRRLALLLFCAFCNEIMNMPRKHVHIYI